jgi:hypothetical protein
MKVLGSAHINQSTSVKDIPSRMYGDDGRAAETKVTQAEFIGSGI